MSSAIAASKDLSNCDITELLTPRNMKEGVIRVGMVISPIRYGKE